MVPCVTCYALLRFGFLCDALFYNEDRHFGNIPLLWTEGAAYKLPPLFDMGVSLSFWGVPDYSKYNPNPYGKEQLKWAKSVLCNERIVFNLSRYTTEVGRHVPPYTDDIVSGLVRRIGLCASSEEVHSFLEVI